MVFRISKRVSLIAFGALLFAVSAHAMNRQEENANNAHNPSVNNRLQFVVGSPIILNNVVCTGNITINSGFSLPSLLQSCRLPFSYAQHLVGAFRLRTPINNTIRIHTWYSSVFPLVSTQRSIDAFRSRISVNNNFNNGISARGSLNHHENID